MENKEKSYENIKAKLTKFYEKYNNMIELCFTSKMASVSSVLKNEFSDLKFVGFYIVVEKENKDRYLEIGPYVSDILATPRIDYGRGVCGSCWEEKKVIIENNVSKCSNYIACDEETQSEIVLPVFDRNGEVIAVWDIDSTLIDRFDEMDRMNLEEIAKQFL